MKPKLVIAGAGETGLALASRVEHQWTPILLEKDPQRVQEIEAKSEAESGLRIFHGDASSALTLKRANAKGAGYAVAVTNDDEANLEFCRLMKELGTVNLVALASKSAVATQLEALGVTTVSRPISVATVLEGSLDQGRRTTNDIGLGQGEIYQVTVQAHSPVIGKSLSTLRPQSWLLGAIYRSGQLVVPHGSTVIQAGDKCLLVGNPEILPGIADYFQSGSSEFPLQFGTRYCLWESQDGRRPDPVECQWLLERTEATGLALLSRGEGEPEDFLGEAMAEDVVMKRLNSQEKDNLTFILDETDCALLVTPPPTRQWWDLWGVGGREILRALELTPDPVLISRGSHPYRRILVAVSPSPGALRAAELAVDLARKLEAELSVIAVAPPDFVVGAEYKDQLLAALDAAKARAHLYSRRVKTHLVEGNPVNKVIEFSKDFDLLVIAHRRCRRFSLTRTDVSRHLLYEATTSVLVLPFSEDGLPRG